MGIWRIPCSCGVLKLESQTHAMLGKAVYCHIAGLERCLLLIYHTGHTMWQRLHHSGSFADFILISCLTRRPKRSNSQAVPLCSLAMIHSSSYNNFNSKGFPQVENIREFCTPIINTRLEVKDKCNPNAGVAMYSSTNRLLAVQMVSNKDIVHFRVRRVVLDVWTGWLLAICNQDESGTHSLILPSTGGRYLLFWCALEAQVGHIDFQHRKNKFCDFLETVTGA